MSWIQASWSVCRKVGRAAVLIFVRTSRSAVEIIVDTVCEVFRLESAPETSNAIVRAARPSQRNEPAVKSVPVSQAVRVSAAPVRSTLRAQVTAAPVGSSAVAVESAQPASATPPESVTLVKASEDGAKSSVARSNDAGVASAQIVTSAAVEHARPSPAAGSRRASGCRVQLVIVYLVVIALLNLLGVKWLMIGIMMAEDFLSNCRVLKLRISGMLDKICRKIPMLQRIREGFAYSTQVETGRGMWHQLTELLDRTVEVIWVTFTGRGLPRLC